MRTRLVALFLGVCACLLAAWVSYPHFARWWFFTEIETGTLSNGWSYSLYSHRDASESRFLLRVVESSGGIRELQARSVNVEPQMNGTDAIQFIYGGKEWESPIDEWWDLFYQPGLWPHSQGMKR